MSKVIFVSLGIGILFFYGSPKPDNENLLKNNPVIDKFRIQQIAAYIVDNQKSRISDAWGSGQFGAQRNKGERTHNGLDIVVKSGDKIYAPFRGTIIREAVPYKNDKSYRGIVVKGLGEWAGFEIKIFYTEGLLSGEVKKGDVIGTAQDLTIKYPKITNHIHVEVTKNNQRIDPFEIWQMSF